MCEGEERSDELKGFCRHYGNIRGGIMLSLRSTSNLTSFRGVIGKHGTLLSSFRLGALRVASGGS